MADGWRCPGCGRNWAPHVDECRKCEPGAAGGAERAQVVQDRHEPTLGDLWPEFAAWSKRHYKAGSCRTMGMHRKTWGRTRVPIGDDGTLVADLRWSQATPSFADMYRAVRETTSNRRGGTVQPGTINRELTTIQQMFNYYVGVRKTLPRNPIDDFERVDEASAARQTYLSTDQVKRFLEAGPPLFQDIGWTAYRCAGMRHSEARLLKKSEIDWEARVINLPSSRNKSGRARVIPFPQDVETILKRHCEISRGPLVFVNPRDPQRVGPVALGTMQGWLSKARRVSGLKGFDGERIVIHTLRHSGVTQLVQDGAPEGFVRAAAGMSDATFRRYLKFGRDQQAALRRVMDRQVEGATPITGELAAERRDTKRIPGAPALGLVSSSDE